MHLPHAPIYTPHATLAQHFQKALECLRKKVDDYRERPVDPFPELATPRQKIDSLIFETAEETEYDGDDRSVLYLAVEALFLAQTPPLMLDVDSEDDDPPWPEYLIRSRFKEWIHEELAHSVESHPLCCEV